jgi:hypothetical protein
VQLEPSERIRVNLTPLLCSPALEGGREEGGREGGREGGKDRESYDGRWRRGQGREEEKSVREGRLGPISLSLPGPGSAGLRLQAPAASLARN